MEIANSYSVTVSMAADIIGILILIFLDSLDVVSTSFGNTLEIVDGVVTGKILGSIIDGKEKWDIITDLCEDLGIKKEEVVAIGDGSNDKMMLMNSGLGIGLNSKQIATDAADGQENGPNEKKQLNVSGLEKPFWP